MWARKFERSARSGAILLAAVGLFVRLLFVFVGARYYYGAGHEFIHNDSASYSESFINLVTHGVYSYDIANPEAAFGRVPVYPFFWGAHYLVFGAEAAHQAVAISQAVLDSASVYLVYVVALRISGHPVASAFCALLCCFFPFSIIYVSLTQTEILGTFLSLGFFALLFRERPHTGRSALALGLIAGLGLLTKEHLGALLAVAGIWFMGDIRTDFGKASIRGAALVTSFILVYAGWPIRNYVSYDRILLTRSAGSGYARYTEDVNEFRRWVFAWNFDWSPYFEQIAYERGPVEFPPHVFADKDEAALAAHLVDKARRCGSGFHLWRTRVKLAGDHCNHELAAGFSKLRESYIDHYPFRYATVVPLLNLKNVFFKSTARAHADKPTIVRLLVRLLFGIRSLLLLAAFFGLAWYWRNRRYLSLILFTSIIYLFFSVILRQTTFYYLVQADLACLIAGGLVVFATGERVLSRNRSQEPLKG